MFADTFFLFVFFNLHCNSFSYILSKWFKFRFWCYIFQPIFLSRYFSICFFLASFFVCFYTKFAFCSRLLVRKALWAALLDNCAEYKRTGLAFMLFMWTLNNTKDEKMWGLVLWSGVSPHPPLSHSIPSPLAPHCVCSSVSTNLVTSATFSSYTCWILMWDSNSLSNLRH